MKIFKFLLVISVLGVYSCQQISDDYWERKQAESYISPYKGIYVGNYTGSDKGSIRLEISAKDFVDIKRTSSTNGYTENFEGGMIGSSFNNVLSRTSGFKVLGNMIISAQNTYSGTWLMNEGNSGTWTLKKE